MKRIIYMILVAAGVTFAFTQCGKDEVKLSQEQEAFLEKATYGVYAGSDLFVYTEGACQYALGESEKSSRVQNDAMDKYFSVTFKADPIVEKEVQATVVVNNIGGNADGNATLSILKMDGGKVWAWDASSSRGYLLPWK
jgi:hypothetical protein